MLNFCNGAPREYVLCSHIDGDRWYCHSAGLISEDAPFDTDGLVVKDIRLDAASADLGRPLRPKKRIRAHARRGLLEGAVAKHLDRRYA